MLHDGVMRRSVASAGSFDVDCVADAVDMMTDTSAGGAWKDIWSWLYYHARYVDQSMQDICV